jgi:hypothetical protein
LTIYVDDAFISYGLMKMSHMMADTDEELHGMADALGLNRRHFQQVRSGDHYDVSKGYRERALKLGAITIKPRQMAAYAWFKRTYNSAPSSIAEAEKEWAHAIRQRINA